MRIFILNMVSSRCVTIVKRILDHQGLAYVYVERGEVEIRKGLNEEQRKKLKSELKDSGFELVEEKTASLVEKIKLILIELIHYSETVPKVKVDEYLCEKLGVSYAEITRVFSKVKGVTIEHYIKLHKIERVKEMLIYENASLKEIARIVGFKGTTDLRNQFKRVTGLAPSFFRNIKRN